LAEQIIDPLWPHFRPLWTDLQSISKSDIFIAGGYGLFLKQLWLRQNEIKTVVPLESWRNASPRVTKDVDLILTVDLIGSERNQKVRDVLNDNQFRSATEVGGKHWKFVKDLDKEQSVVLEFHSPVPIDKMKDVQFDEMRVKHKPSLGENGVHGRTNPEAMGCNFHPTYFEWEQTGLQLVNPVTWSIRKLIASRDRWVKSQDQSKLQEFRGFSQEQATKHAQDVCRIVAMVTESERDDSQKIVEELRGSQPFVEASKILNTHFRSDNPSVLAVRTYWAPESWEQINAVLDGWFR